MSLPFPLFETHCHLDMIKETPPEVTVQNAQDVGVAKFLTIATSKDNLERVIQLASDQQKVYCSQGIHPHDAYQLNDELLLEKLNKNLSHPKVVAVGEIGLDFHYNKSSKEDQIKAFETQLEMAINHNLPVVIHSREAEEETKNILKKFLPKLKSKAVIHSFTSSINFAKWAVGQGLYIGINGIVTFKNAKEVQEVAGWCPLGNILIETDSPFLAPVPHRGRENNPSYLHYVAEFLANLKNVTYESLAKTTYDNGMNLFNIKEEKIIENLN